MKIIKLLFYNRFNRFMVRTGVFLNFVEASERVKLLLREYFYIVSVFFQQYLFLLAAVNLIGTLVFKLFNYNISYEVSVLSFQICVITAMTLFFNKDFFNGQGLVNRYTGFQVVDVKSNKFASPFQCLLRNVTFFLFPFEFFLILMNKGRRIGDYLAGTRLEKVEPVQPELLFEEIKHYRFNPLSILVLLLPGMVYIFLLLYISY